MWAKLRDWYIVIIGVCLLAGSFFLASRQTSSIPPAISARVRDIAAVSNSAGCTGGTTCGAPRRNNKTRPTPSLC